MSRPTEPAPLSGCGRTLIDPNSETLFPCGTVDFCDDCIERFLVGVGYYTPADVQPVNGGGS